MSIQGKGIYIWQFRRSDGGNLTAIVDNLKKAGMTHVIPKIADGILGNINESAAYLPNFTHLCHQAGIQVIPYHFVYGRDPVNEAITVIRELKKQNYDGLVINAEVAYRDSYNPGYSARVYCDALKKELPDLPLALSTFRYPSLHRNFPFRVFLEYCDYNMPQVYWMQANGTVPQQLARTLEEYKAYPPVPMIPTGAAFKEHGWSAIPQDQKIFVDEVKKHGLAGCNWWEYYEAFNLQPQLGQAIVEAKWDVETLPIEGPQPEPVTYPFWAVCTAEKALNIRSQPWVETGNVVGYLLAGEKRLVYEQSGTWWRIGNKQWVSSNFMRKIDDPVTPEPLTLEERVADHERRITALEAK